jgi:PAS domain S-box-containing protein
MLNSLKNRILVYFLLITIIIVCIFLPLNRLNSKKEAVIRQEISMLNNLYLSYIKDLRYVSEFLTLGVTSPDFFITGENLSLKKHDEHRDTVQYILSNLISHFSSSNSARVPLIYEIQRDYEIYCRNLDSVIYYLYKRGYRDFGLEGEMISYVYKAEKNLFFKEIDQKLRKNERDYLNRNDSAEVVSLNKTADNLLIMIQSSNRIKEAEKAELSILLEKYKNAFNELVLLDKRLGLRSDKGLKTTLFESGDKLEGLIAKTISSAEVDESSQVASLNATFTIIYLILFLSVLLISIYLSRYLVNHLEKLTEYISQLAAHNFNYKDPNLSLRRSSKEIREIYKGFRNLAAQLKIREKQRDNALEVALEKERMYRELADLLPQSIYETDCFGNIIYSNKAWHNTFGYSQKEIEEGLNLIEILQTNNEDNLFGINKVENSDFIAIRKGGTKFPALVFSDVITKEEKVVGRRGIIIDATLRNKYVESLQKETVRAITSDKLKSSFLANMSHEIRTPMNSIMGFANLLSAEMIPEEQKKDYIRHIQSSGQMLLNLIDDIIDIAKIEAGEIKVKPVRCEPLKLINDLMSSFEGYKIRLGKEHIKIQTNLPETETAFRTDPFRLRQIITNLVSNAIKFTDKGSVSIRYEIKNERFLEFSIEDTGIGLSKEDLKVIFSRFKRTNYSEEKNISGTGLGLTISKNLVELLGGQMWVSSVPGEGTRFWFQLPYTHFPEQGEKTTASQTDQGIDLLDLRAFTILIAEDDDYSFTYLKEVLKKTKARIIRAINGKEVIEAVKLSGDIDMILMDIQMPFLDGYDASTEIKKLKPSLPIIAQTARAMEGDREKAILSGCDDYITKPVNPQKLLAKIHQFLNRSQTQSTLSHPVNTLVDNKADIKKIIE